MSTTTTSQMTLLSWSTTPLDSESVKVSVLCCDDWRPGPVDAPAVGLARSLCLRRAECDSAQCARIGAFVSGSPELSHASLSLGQFVVLLGRPLG